MLESALTLVIVAVIILSAVLAYAASKPDTFAVERQVRIAAGPEKIFPLIANLREMNTWNPFADFGPDVKADYSGPPSGVGAAHTWNGRGKAGAGRIEVIEAVAPSKIVMKLDMERPMPAHNTVTFTVRPDGDVTVVSWAMAGPQPLLGKVVNLVVDCDKMVGRQFETGLTRLKARVEAPAKPTV
jgi:uncharacterized protein YndB with AHSA1/START domain